MKNSILKLAIVTVLTSTLSFESVIANNNSNQVTKTTFRNGEIYPLVNLPEVKISSTGTVKQNAFDNSNIDLIYESSANLLLVTKHNGEYLPSILLKEATIVANRSEKITESKFRKALNGLYSFALGYLAHFGVIY